MAFKDFVKTVKNEAGDAVEITKMKAKISKEKPQSRMRMRNSENLFIIR